IAAARVQGRSGAWILGGEQDRKIAAIGVRVARGVAMHGVAINADPDLNAFSRIVPCGISDAGVTSISAEIGRHVGVVECAEVFEAHLEQSLAPVLARSLTV